MKCWSLKKRNAIITHHKMGVCMATHSLAISIQSLHYKLVNEYSLVLKRHFARKFCVGRQSTFNVLSFNQHALSKFSVETFSKVYILLWISWCPSFSSSLAHLFRSPLEHGNRIINCFNAFKSQFPHHMMNNCCRQHIENAQSSSAHSRTFI